MSFERAFSCNSRTGKTFKFNAVHNVQSGWYYYGVLVTLTKAKYVCLKYIGKISPDLDIHN